MGVLPPPQTSSHPDPPVHTRVVGPSQSPFVTLFAHVQLCVVASELWKTLEVASAGPSEMLNAMKRAMDTLAMFAFSLFMACKNW